MDLLGAAWSEQDLLSLGYAIERTMGVRRPPFSTPPLIDGKPPAAWTTSLNLTGLAGSVLNLVYEEASSRLQYTLKPAGTSFDRAAAIWIHVGTPGAPGAARHLLFREGGALSGSISVTAADRRDIGEGRWLVRVYLRDRPGSSGDQAIAFPR
jgi:hypothetical protein